MLQYKFDNYILKYPMIVKKESIKEKNIVDFGNVFRITISLTNVVQKFFKF